MNQKSNKVKSPSVKELQYEAFLLDIAGRSKLNKAELLLAIAERQVLFAKAAAERAAIK